METKELVLNIAVNVGRLCRWAMEGRKSRVEQFLVETEEYVKAFGAAPTIATARSQSADRRKSS